MYRRYQPQNLNINNPDEKITKKTEETSRANSARNQNIDSKDYARNIDVNSVSKKLPKKANAESYEAINQKKTNGTHVQNIQNQQNKQNNSYKNLGQNEPRRQNYTSYNRTNNRQDFKSNKRRFNQGINLQNFEQHKSHSYNRQKFVDNSKFSSQGSAKLEKDKIRENNHRINSNNREKTHNNNFNWQDLLKNLGGNSSNKDKTKQKNFLKSLIPDAIYNKETKKILGILSVEDLFLISLILLLIEKEEEDQSVVYALIFVLISDWFDLSFLGLD